ncbi:hypothetical protein [Balneicella halophila]|uniref:hypothetical protein n=1 Tax=Balneicella halophila TaxID=1537566 RepID=UPI001057BE14|nr:hypothetical protein [Balneicella halophila]
MKRLLFFIVLLLMSCIFLFSQKSSTVPYDFFNQFRSSKNVEKATGTERYVNYEGSPYSNEKFIKGQVKMKDSYVFSNIPLRYNIYKE